MQSCSLKLYLAWILPGGRVAPGVQAANFYFTELLKSDVKGAHRRALDLRGAEAGGGGLEIFSPHTGQKSVFLFIQRG